jgi:hypothetical protein
MSAATGAFVEKKTASKKCQICQRHREQNGRVTAKNQRSDE